MSKEGKIANEQTESTHENEVEEVGFDIESSNASGYSASGESVAPPADNDNNDGSNTETSPNPYLPRSVQTEMESSFNQDFSNVNVYQNSSKANAYGARAYAYGNEIHFSEGQYNPYSKEGQQLLKHELAHVVQQRQGRTNQPTEALEQEADQISLYDSGYFQLENQSVAVESPMVQFKWYEIKADEIKGIRGMLTAKKGPEALEEIKGILQVDEVIAKFLADYEDIGIALLEQLDSSDKRDEYMYVDSLFVVPFKAIDAENLRVLKGYRTQEGKETLEDIAEMTGVDLDEMITLSGLSRNYIDFDVSEFLLKLEENLSDEKKQEEGIKEFLHQLAFHNMFEKVEDQGGDKIENERPAADSKYADNGFYGGIKEGLSSSRQISLEDEREAKKNAKRGKEKRKARKSLRKAKRAHPNIGGLFIRQLFQKLISMKGVRLGEISKLLGIQGIYGVSFGDDAIVNLKLDRKNQELIITAEQLPMDRLNYVDEASGSAYLADQINLVSPEIRLKINQSDKLKIGESAAVTMTVTTDAVDILNMRILGRESTIGMGRIRGNGLELKYTQQLSRGHKMRTMHLFLTLMEMVMKGPSMIQPFIYEIVNAFTLSDENREEESKKQQKLFFESIKGGLADELDFSLKFDDLEVTHFYMTQEYAPEDVSIKKAGEQFRPTYIERIVLSRDELEDKKHEFGIKSESLTEEQLKAAIDNLPEDAFDEATRQKILSVQPEEGGGSYVELYEELVAEYNRVRLKKIPDETKHLSTQEKTLIEVMEYLKPFAIETMEEYQAAQESEGYKSLSGPAKKTIELITSMNEYTILKLLYEGLQLRMKAPEIIENRESAVMQAVNFLSNIDIRSKEDLALAKGQMSAPMEQLNEMFGITEFSDEAKAIIESLESMVDYRDLMREYNAEANKKQSKKEKRKSIIDAAEYFESYRTFEFNVNSHEGAIEGGTMIENSVVPSLEDTLEESGISIENLQGVGDLSFKELDIKTTQNSFGFIYDKKGAVEERNYIELEAFIPGLKGDAINFLTEDIHFSTDDFEFNEVTVPVTIKFREEFEKDGEMQPPYEVVLGEIHIKDGTVHGDYFNYADEFNFQSELAHFKEIRIKAGPIPDVTHFSLNFEKVELENASVNFQGQTIASSLGKPIFLHGGKYDMNPDGNVFTLDNIEFEGDYVGDGNHVKFKQQKNESSDRGPFLFFEQKSNGDKRIKLNLDSTIEVPLIQFTIPVSLSKDKKNPVYPQLLIGKEGRGVKITNIYADIEMVSTDKTIVNELSMESLETDDYELQMGKGGLSATRQTLTQNELGEIGLYDISLKNLMITTIGEDALSIMELMKWDTSISGVTPPEYQHPIIESAASNTNQGDRTVLITDDQLDTSATTSLFSGVERSIIPDVIEPTYTSTPTDITEDTTPISGDKELDSPLPSQPGTASWFNPKEPTYFDFTEFSIGSFVFANSSYFHLNQEKTFEETDTNKDDVISFNEYKASQKEKKLSGKTLRNRFNQMDQDKDASVSEEEFSKRKVQEEELTPDLVVLLEVFELGGLTMTSSSEERYGAGELYKLLSHLEVEHLLSRGKVEKLTGKDKKELVAEWDLSDYFTDSEPLVADYDHDTDIMTITDVPLLDLFVPLINLSAGGVKIKSHLSGGSPAELNGLKINKVRYDFRNKEFIIDDIEVNQINAVGLEVNAPDYGIKMNLPNDQYVSLGGISAGGWKYNLEKKKNALSVDGTGRIDAEYMSIGKLMADLSGALGMRMDEDTELTARTGHIAFRMKEDKSISLSVDNPEFMDGKMDIFLEDDTFLKNFLGYAEMDKFTLQIDSKGRKTILLKNPKIYNYEFSSTDQYGRSYTSAKATLSCLGELRIFEGNYDQFVYGMENELKEFGKDQGIKRTTGEADAWLIDGSGCTVTIRNLEFITATERDTRTATEIALDEAIHGNSLSEVKDSEMYLERRTMEYTAETIANIGSDQEIARLIDRSSRRKANAKRDSNAANDPYYDILEALDTTNADLDIDFLGQLLSVDVREGWIDFNDLIDEFSDFITSWTDVISEMEDGELFQRQELRDMAEDLLHLIDKGAQGEIIIACIVLFTMIGGAIGAIGGSVPGAVIGAGTGARIGTWVGIALAGLIEVAKRWVFDDLLDPIKALLEDIKEGRNYGDSMNNVLQYVIENISILDKQPSEDVPEEEAGFFLVFNVEANLSPVEGTTNIYQYEIMKLGDHDDSHVTTQRIHLAGIIRYFIENPFIPVNSTEETLGDLWSELPEGSSFAEALAAQISKERSRDLDTEMQNIGNIGSITGQVTGSNEFDFDTEILSHFIPGYLSSQFGGINLSIRDIQLNEVERALRGTESVDFNLFGGQQTVTSVEADYRDNSQFDENFNRTDNEQSGDVKLPTLPGFSVDMHNSAFGLGFAIVKGIDFSMGERIANDVPKRDEAITQDQTKLTINSIKAFGFQAAFRKEDGKVGAAISRSAEDEFHEDRILRRLIKRRFNDTQPYMRVLSTSDVDEQLWKLYGSGETFEESSTIIEIDQDFYWLNELDWRAAAKMMFEQYVNPHSPIVFVAKSDKKKTVKDVIAIYMSGFNGNYIVPTIDQDDFDKWLGEKGSIEKNRKENEQARFEVEREYWKENRISLPREHEAAVYLHQRELGKRLYHDRKEALKPSARVVKLNSGIGESNMDIGETSAIAINPGFYWLHKLDKSAAFEMLRSQGLVKGSFPNYFLEKNYPIVVEEEVGISSQRVVGTLSVGMGSELEIDPLYDKFNNRLMEMWIDEVSTEAEQKKIEAENNQSVKNVGDAYRKQVAQDEKEGKDRKYLPKDGVEPYSIK